MSSLSPARRLTAALGGLALAVGTLAASHSPASAAPIEGGSLDASISVGSDNEGPGPTQCTVLETGAEKPPVALKLGKRSQKESRSAKLTYNSDAADVTRVSGTSKVTSVATAKKGSIDHVALTMTGTARIDADLGAASECEPAAAAQLEAFFIFKAKKAGWLTLKSTSTAKPAYFILTLVGETGNTQMQSLQLASNGTRTDRIHVAAERYQVQVIYAVIKQAKVAGDTHYKKTAHGSLKLTLDYAPGGSAKTKTTGSAAKAVKLAENVSCSAHTLKLTWKGAAGKASQAQVRVNGKRVATVRNPKPGKSLVIKKVPAGATTNVLVSLGRTTAKRSYEPCG